MKIFIFRSHLNFLITGLRCWMIPKWHRPCHGISSQLCERSNSISLSWDFWYIFPLNFSKFWYLVLFFENFLKIYRFFGLDYAKNGFFKEISTDEQPLEHLFFKSQFSYPKRQIYRNSCWFSSVPKIYAKIFSCKLERCRNWNLRVTAYFYSYKTS